MSGKNQNQRADSRRTFIKSATFAAVALGGLTSACSRGAVGTDDVKLGASMQDSDARSVVIFLYDGMTALDAIGVYEVLRFLPNTKVYFTARRKGPIAMDSRSLSLVAEFSMEEISKADILVIPGGATTHSVTEDAAVIDWVKRIDATTKWTTSVCTGAGVLLKAGLLNGREATTHWASLEYVDALGGKASKKRIVREGKMITAAGVSAGIDMALTLAALECDEETAKAIQLAMEYDPQPPFRSGSADSASPETISLASKMLAENVSRATAAPSR